MLDLLTRLVTYVLPTIIVMLIVPLVAQAINKKPKYKFFGITAEKPVLRIYLSRLEIKPGGTVGTEPITTGYVGPAINIIEYKAAQLVTNLLRAEIIAKLPSGARKWLAGKNIGFAAIEPIIDISPKQEAELVYDNLIIIGSSIYNIANKCYLEHPAFEFYFDRDSNGNRVIKLKSQSSNRNRDQGFPGRSVNQELGYIQKIKDLKHGTTVYICAGLGASATYGTVRHLVENWEDFLKTYGDANFAICLGFPDQAFDNEQVIEPEILYETPKGRIKR